MQRFLSLFFLGLSLPLFFVGVSSVHSQLLQPGTQGEITKQLETGTGEAVAQKPIDPRAFVFNIIQIFLAALGTIMLVQIFIGGYHYLTARGEEEKITRAQDTIRRAVIGLVLILASFAISRFVIHNIGGTVDEGEEFFEKRDYYTDYGATGGI